MSHDDTARAVGLSAVKPRWDAARTERALGAVHGRLRARTRIKRASVAIVGASAVALASWGVLHERALPSEQTASVKVVAPPARETPRFVHFKDGSSVELDSKESELSVAEVSESHVEVELKRGSGHFSVVPRDSRTFSVRSGVVTARVTGTDFRVIVQGATAAVEVVRGVVHVSWPTGSVELRDGERGLFPPATPLAPATVDSASEEPANTLRRDDSATARPKAEEFRVLAKRRDYSAAYKILVSTPAAVGANSADLLLAADVARLSGHPAEAVPYLERLLATHPTSGEAPLAAFTMGRTLMGLGRADAAIAAFAKARSLAPRGPLAEDALVRQVEAASRTGNTTLAKKLATQYERSYPNGRKRDIVRGYAGISE
jgi:transmembrane sensor